MPVMGTVQSGNRSLAREPGVVRWAGGSRLFTDRFASANAKVAGGRAVAGNVGTAGESPDAPAAFVRTWLLTGSLSTRDARVEEVR